MPSPDEDRLIGQAQGGDVAAFEALVRRYDGNVLRLALRIVRSEEEARDIYQEAFLRIYRTLAGFRHECSFETWVYRVVTNLCLDHLRRRAARPDETAGAAADDRQEGDADIMAQIADDRPDHDPERYLARREIRRRIEAALQKLAPRERLVFELRHDHGLRTRAIAERLETSDETVRNCLFRAHQELRRALGDLWPIGRRIAGRVGPAQAET